MKILIDKSVKSYWRSIPVLLIRDERLSYEARGVAAHIMSMAPRWEFQAVSLPYILKVTNNASGHLGRDITRRIIKEFEVCGYLSRTRFRDGDGKWIWQSSFNPLAAAAQKDFSLATSSEMNELSSDGLAEDGGGGIKSSFKEDFKNKVLPHKINPNIELDTELKTNDVLRDSDDTQCIRNACIEIDLSHHLLKNHLVVINSLFEKFESVITHEVFQQIVDELAAVISSSRNGLHVEIRSVRAWLQAVLSSAERGEFIPEFGLAISTNRRQRNCENNQWQSSLEKRKKIHHDVEKSQNGANAIAHIKRMLSNKDNLNV